MINRSVQVPLTVAAFVGVLLMASPARADLSPAPPPACSIEGTEDDDVLQGTPEADVICGFGGDDIIVGQDGDDVLVGGHGDDLLVGGPGRDQLYGDAGDDRLVDTQQPSTVDGGADTDLCVAVTGSAATNCERLFILIGNAAHMR